MRGLVSFSWKPTINMGLGQDGRLWALLIAVLLIGSLINPSISFADEVNDLAASSSSSQNASSEDQQEQIIGDVIVSADDESAFIEGASFALADFSRAQRGSDRRLNDQYMGYSYYQGDSTDYAVAVVYQDQVLVFVSPDVHGLCDIADATSRQQLKEYFIALDAASISGGIVVTGDEEWLFTSDDTYVLGDVVFHFNVEVGANRYYVTAIGLQGEDISADNTDAMGVPTHVDFARVVPPNQVQIVPPASGFDSMVQFFQGIDYSPLWVTLRTTGVAIVFIFVLGLAAAYFTLNISKRMKNIFDTIFTIPMVLPPTVCGFLLLLALGRNTPIGSWFYDIGAPLVFSWPATVIAATVVAFPLMYRNARGAFETLDPNMMDAARTLGWSNPKIFFKLMLPLAWSSIAAATVLAFARALGEFGATLFLAGNYVGITRTIPIAIYFEWMSGNTDVAIFWTVILIIFSFIVILFINLWSNYTTKYRRRSGE